MTDLITRLRAYTDHRGDGIPTQPVNPDGEEAADRIEALEAALTQCAEAPLSGWTIAQGIARATLSPSGGEAA